MHVEACADYRWCYCCENWRLNNQSEMMALTKSISRLLISTLRFIVRVFVGVVGALASAEPDLEDDASDTTLSVGVLNYRTGRLDDGTDPYGWYEHG